ncbi:MAG: hypothetical protein ABJI96_11330 [Paracoccaceae bacterium]
MGIRRFWFALGFRRDLVAMVQNVVWYPTVLAFAAGALAYLFLKPDLAEFGWFNTAAILIIYWGATFMSLQGAGFAAKMTKWFVLLGTVLPGILIIGLGFLWVVLGNPVEFLRASRPQQ